MNRALAASVLLFTAVSSLAQAPVPAARSDENARLAAAVGEVRAQQLVIAQNQQKIQQQLGALGEYIRLARIYASRGGK